MIVSPSALTIILADVNEDFQAVRRGKESKVMVISHETVHLYPGVRASRCQLLARIRDESPVREVTLVTVNPRSATTCFKAGRVRMEPSG